MTKSEIQQALNHLEFPLEVALKTSIRNVRAFHTKEKPARWFHNSSQMAIGQRWTPIDRGGLYVPGGLAAYPSSVIMTVIPAKVAGVKQVILVTPVKKDGKVNPIVLAAAYFARGGCHPQNRWGAGHRGPGLRHQVGSGGGQDHRPRESFCGPGQAPGFRAGRN